jgi:DNA polymerase-1
VLGTIAEQVKSKGLDVKVVIASGDMDTMQLVKGNDVVVYTLKKGINETTIYNEKAVIERFGFKPELLPDFKGLKGDPSDNIIGIEGIGDKTATDIIKNFGTLENLYKKLKKGKQAIVEKGIKERIVNLLEEKEEEAMFSKTLAEIRRDAPIDFKLEESAWRDNFNQEEVGKIFDEFGFKSLMARLVKKENGFAPLAVAEEEKIDPEKLNELAIKLWLIDSNYTNPEQKEILAYTKRKTLAEAEKVLDEKIKKDGLEKLLNDIELPLTGILKGMQDLGVLIDVKFLRELSVEYHRELDRLEKKIWGLAGEEFNIDSPKQIGKIIFEKLELKVKGLKKTSTGAMSTNISELTKLLGTHPILMK